VLDIQQRPDMASFGCLIVSFGIVPIFLLGSLGAWLGGIWNEEAVVYGRWIGWLAGLGVLTWALASFVPYERRRRMRGRKDAADQLVQEIIVSHPRVFEIYLISDNEPILVFDIGDGRFLFLQGQWLREPDKYGAPPQDGDADERYVNGLPEPFSFPSVEFKLTRLPHSGRVLRIAVGGGYLAPGKTVDALQREYEFGDSEIFDGDIEDIAGVLAREHAKRVDT
jgi:hypothetical protein